MRRKPIKAATQEYVDISEIREDTVILRDGTLRAVILVSSINFALKSDDEQNAIIGAYVSFLNSLEHPLEIVVQSRKLNIDHYLERLKELEKTQTNELLKIQTAEYRAYVEEFVELGDIMTKRFYVIVPYNPLSDKKQSFFKRTISLFSPTKVLHLEEERFLKRRRDLLQRVNHIIGGLNSIGLNAAVLDTQGLIELYYNTYNPDISRNQKLADVEKMRVEQ